ncbi:MAG: S-adenosyl-l-methionine hydroxide adenosyltransferase family protein [Candidatus Bathyarchaeota archaeon]|nr:S-adenosyl-l-methionine hydroxide adenosyltransferase family protein [Candidatus Bathyarchaeota archaeon]
MITLTTDFGLKDPYVAEMKGVILSLNQNAVLIDITHEVAKFDVREAAFALASAAPYFPAGTVHLGVVDPGVGTARRGIVVETQRGFFVGPDNGILMLAAQQQGIKHVYELVNPKFRRAEVSGTFHGRDIFAPAAAYLDLGVKSSEFGPEVTDPKTPTFANVTQKDGGWAGEVLHVDGFGNIITNLQPKQLPQTQTITLKIADLNLTLPFVKTYGDTEPQTAIALIGSHGFLEVALNQGSAAEKFQAKPGSRVEVLSV